MRIQTANEIQLTPAALAKILLKICRWEQLDTIQNLNIQFAGGNEYVIQPIAGGRLTARLKYNHNEQNTP